VTPAERRELAATMYRAHADHCRRGCPYDLSPDRPAVCPRGQQLYTVWTVAWRDAIDALTDRGVHR